MSSPTTDVDSETDHHDGPSTGATTGGDWRRQVRHPGKRVLTVSVLATLTVGASTVLRILYNVPVDPIEFPNRVLSAVGAMAALVVALALVTVALSTSRPGVHIGLLFAGVFGVLATLSDAAAIPAVVAITGGGALALGSALGTPYSYRGLRYRLVAVAFPVAIGLSLATTTGILNAGLRGVGTVVFLSAVTLLVVRIEADPVALIAGAVGFAVVVAASTAVPYVTGSALLVGFGVVGGPHLFAATAAFGGVATTVSGFRGEDHLLVAGAVLLLLAGVPATPTAAMAVCLGATLALVDFDALVGTTGPQSTATGVSDR